jgi:hypothetical protein
LPALVVEVLLAPGFVDARRLNVTVRIAADPDVAPGRWDRQRSNPLKCVLVSDAPAFGVEVAEAAATTAAADSWA